MSEWRRITDKDDISLNEDTETLDVLVDTNDFGNVYIEIPVEFIKKVLNGNQNKA